MAEQLNFTNANLKSLPLPEPRKRKSYSDDRVPGLLLRITHSGVKTFLVYRKVNNKPVRVTIGRYPDIAIEQARRLAKRNLADMAEGKNPNSEKKMARAKTKSLGEILQGLSSRSSRSKAWNRCRLPSSHAMGLRRLAIQAHSRYYEGHGYRPIPKTR